MCLGLIQHVLMCESKYVYVKTARPDHQNFRIREQDTVMDTDSS